MSFNGTEEVEILLPLPHEKYPGFFKVPGYPHFAVNQAGEVLNTLTGRLPKPGWNYKGYPVVTINDHRAGKIRTGAIHRLVALTFIGRPKRHWDKDHSDLVVNHIDGKKWNNARSNLEWLTNEENMQHAVKMGLHGSSRPVVAMDIRSGNITRFLSADAAALAFGINSSTMNRFLTDGRAGQMTKDWHVFKWDDGSEWREIPEGNRLRTSLPIRSGYWLATEVKTGKSVYHNVLAQLLTCVGLVGTSFSTNSTYYIKRNLAYRGFLFQYFSGFEELKAHLTSRTKSPKG